MRQAAHGHNRRQGVYGSHLLGPDLSAHQDRAVDLKITKGLEGFQFSTLVVVSGAQQDSKAVGLRHRRNSIGQIGEERIMQVADDHTDDAGSFGGQGAGGQVRAVVQLLGRFGDSPSGFVGNAG